MDDSHSLVPYDASAAASSSASTSNPSSIAFSNLDFTSQSERANIAGMAPNALKKLQAASGTLKKNRHALPKDANQALEILSKRKERLDALEPEQREKKEEKERWEKVLLKAEGEKVRDDETRLKKMAKRQEREKRKSAKAWCVEFPLFLLDPALTDSAPAGTTARRRWRRRSRTRWLSETPTSRRASSRRKTRRLASSRRSSRARRCRAAAARRGRRDALALRARGGRSRLAVTCCSPSLPVFFNLERLQIWIRM